MRRPTQADPVVGDRAMEAKKVEAKGTEPAPDKSAATQREREGELKPVRVQRAKERTPEAPRRGEDESEEEEKATDAKSTDAKANGGDDTDARSTRAKDTRARGTKPPARPRPKEPPLPPANMPWRERWKFYDKNYDDYPPDIQRMLDRIERRTRDQQQQVDAAIREHYARELGQHWGIPVKTTKRIPMKAAEKLPLPRKNTSSQQRWKFYDRHRDDYPRHIQELIDNPDNRTEAGAKQIEQVIRDENVRQSRQDTPGGEWEKTNIAERTGERPNLSATSTTKDGAEVQIDDFDPDRRVAREY